MSQQRQDDKFKDECGVLGVITEQRQVAWVALIGTVLWGIFGYFSMPQRKDPDIPVITAMVMEVADA